jgi:fumarylacetoacetase
MTHHTIDHTHDPALSSWVEGADDHADFPIQNLPLGVFSPKGQGPRIGTAIGDYILDLSAIPDLLPFALSGTTLNAYMGLSKPNRVALRHAVSAVLSDTSKAAALRPHLYPASECTMHLPAHIGDYTDFYVGIHHATNIGKQFRPDQPLLPNYKHIPIGYHGRASSVRLSGTPLVRPKGQTLSPGADAPVYGPTKRLDYELEMGVWVGPGNDLGTSIPIGEAGDHIVGLCLLNDWSARDIQAWEYQPLGPFLAKNFLTSISPWVITAEALAPFRTAQPVRAEGDPNPLPYLMDDKDQSSGALGITLEAYLSTATMRAKGLPPHRLSHGAATNMYWTPAQMIAHHSANGCNLQAGDVLGTGTISSPEPGGFGSMMEITKGGKDPVALETGETRGFLEDGDHLTLNAYAEREGYRRIGFGKCTGGVVPAVG